VTRISVGLPVYNGERYLEQALDSLVHQTHKDLEIIISDNASTDRTAEICREHAERDPRIRYVRQEVNRGGAFNHMFVLSEATAPYFRMFAADDWMAPTCLESCAAALDDHPDVVLAWTGTTMVDEDDNELTWYRTDQVWDDRSPSTRLASLLVPRGDRSLLEWSSPMYGVARREDFVAAYRLTYGGADNEAMIKLALRGHWWCVPEPLFFRRNHPDSSMGTRTLHEAAVWMDPSGKPGRSLPNIRRRLGTAQGVLRTPMPPLERIRCALVLVRVFSRPTEWKAVAWDLRVLGRELLTDLRGRTRIRGAQPRLDDEGSRP